jgi:hypothetical protein
VNIIPPEIVSNEELIAIDFDVSGVLKLRCPPERNLLVKRLYQARKLYSFMIIPNFTNTYRGKIREGYNSGGAFS